MNNNEKKKVKLNWHLVGNITHGFKRYFFFGALGVLFSVFCQYLIPMISTYTIDFVIGGGESNLPGFINNFIEGVGGRTFLQNNLYFCAIAIIAVTAFNGLAAYIRGKNVSLFAELSAKKLKDDLYEHLQLVPYDYHKHTETGDLIQRCTSDVDTVRRFISMQLMEIVRIVLLVVVAAVIMFSIHTQMALVSVALMPIILIVSFLYFRKVRGHFTLSDEAEGDLSMTLQENLMGVRTVRAFGQQKSEVERFTKKNETYKTVTQKMLDLLGIYWGGTDIICVAQILLTTCVGVWLTVHTDRFSLGNTILFTTYTGMLCWPVRQLGRILADLGKATVSLNRLDDILSTPVEQETGKALTPEITGKIVFDDVYFGYDYKDEVLKGISFEVEAGQTIAILGATGSGKSSLVHLLQRLYPCTGGKILLDDVDVNDIEHKHLRANISIVLQEPFLYSRSIMENIRITDPSASEKEVYNVARTASVHDVILKFDKGYDTMVGERGVTLSGGQQQRVAIARTLMRKAPILVFDDSMSAVDTETDKTIREALGQMRGQCTTFIISHRVTTLRESDMILVLDEGRLVQRGTHEELMAQDGVYSRIAKIQSMNADAFGESTVSDEDIVTEVMAEADATADKEVQGE